MTAPGKVTLKLDVDNTDALRKIRQVRRAARRRTTTTQVALDIACTLLGVGYGLTGLFRHSAFLVATGCLFFILSDRR